MGYTGDMAADISSSIQMMLCGVLMSALIVEAPRRWPWTKWAYLVLLVAMFVLLASRLAGYELRVTMAPSLYWTIEVAILVFVAMVAVLYVRSFLRNDLAEPR